MLTSHFISNIVFFALTWAVIAQPQDKVSQPKPESEIIKQNLQNGMLSLTTNLVNLFIKESPNKNLLFSPLSIYNALALLHLGSADKTEEEFATVLGFSNPMTTESKTSMQEVLKNISKIFRAYENAVVTIDTGLFVKDGVKLNNDFKEKAINTYQAKVQAVDFSKESTTNQINEWISNQTAGHIPKLFDKKLEDNLIMLLPNVLYFNSVWANRFRKQSTSKANFSVTADKKVEVNMMTNVKRVRYYNSTDKRYTALGLSYASSEFIMYFILPYENQTLSSLVENLKVEELRNLTSRSSKQWVDYKIPRMKFSWKHDIDNELKHLGIKSAYSNPNFSKMFDEKVELSKVIHATDIDIDEDGTTAAAVTVPIISLRSGLSQPLDKPLRFVLNRPFVITLYNKETETILFYGVVHDPQG